ncbi:MAG: CARDB domain-containing protein, partial [Chloroflexota bacterium]|nr:CARDB domain-containing protein [Chloroflexota bacterium]
AGTGEVRVPAIIRHPYGAGQVLGVVGHPTDPTRRNEAPLFMNALLYGLSGYAELYGDAVQTFNPAYPPHEFPAYEEVPVSATLRLENYWDAPLTDATLTETISAGYYLTSTVTPTPTRILSTTQGQTLLVWELGELAPHAAITLAYQAVTSPTVLAAGRDTFSQGALAYTDFEGRRLLAAHQPFMLTSQMAARLAGDRDLEADRHYRIPAEGIYLDVALPLENKEATPAYQTVLTDWVYLIVPIVDYADQHVILNANDGETIWMRNEPYLWGDKYPQWEGATAPTQTLTLADWQGDWCVFTSTYGIHLDPPPSTTTRLQDYGSFITIPPTYTDYLTVTEDNELLLPCRQLIWDLGAFNGYEYREPAVRYGVHSRELLSRTVVFHGTPREGTVVLPYDAGSVYVTAGGPTVPFRQYLPAAEPYSAPAPSASELTYLDVWSRTHELELRSSFYDVWDWDSCATCSTIRDQHAGVAVTFGLWRDADGDGIHETLVKEIPTRLDEVQLRLLGKTYSDTSGDVDFTIPAGENLIELPIFKGLGIQIGPEGPTWYDSWRALGAGTTELISVSEQLAYDHLFFQQEIPPGVSNSFLISATIENYNFNREGLYKLHDGGRLIYRQQAAGPNRYEIYDAHVHAAEGWRSDAEVAKRGGPTLVSVYSDTLVFDYQITDPYEPRSGWAFEREYDPYLKSWGYGDLVWSTYVGGSEDKLLFHTLLDAGGRTIVRVSLDNNHGITLTNLAVTLETPAGITVTRLYSDPATAPEPIWPELAFLNRTEVGDARRGVWYFELQVGAVDESLWGQVLELPVVVSADNLPADYIAPPARIALQRPGDPAPEFVSAPAHDLVLTDTLPAKVGLEAALLITDPTVLNALWTALDFDAGDVTADSARAFINTLVPTHALTVSYTISAGVVNFELPAAQRQAPADQDWHLITLNTLLRAHHGTNVVNEGPVINYTDPFSMLWRAEGGPVTVEAHGAAVWVEYECEGGAEESSCPGTQDVTVYEGNCTLPDYGPAEVVIDVLAYNAGDAIARSVTITLSLPAGVTITESLPVWDVLTEQEVVWNLGDLAPGAWKQFQIILWVEPDEGEWGGEGGVEAGSWHATALPAPYIMGNIQGIKRTDGEFTDDYSQQVVRGQVGDTLWFKVRFAPRLVYLPVLMRDYSYAPDLLVNALTVDQNNPAALTVEIANLGNAPAANFWVDLYLDPETPPEVNQSWTMLCHPYGAAWFVESLAAGESLTLTIDDAYYQADQSRWPVDGYPSGEHALWAYVDSWGGESWASVQESDEGNNRYGPVALTGTGASAVAPQSYEPIPPRLLVPAGGGE